MSAFYATCPTCGETYFHLFVGTSLLSGHKCSGTARPKPPNVYERPASALDEQREAPEGGTR